MARERKTDKLYKSIPSSECGVGVVCHTKSGETFTITQNYTSDKHTLWRHVDGGYTKVDASESPYDLYKLIPWER